MYPSSVLVFRKNISEFVETRTLNELLLFYLM